MSKRAPETREARETRRQAAYERGWVDSLRAYQDTSSQPTEDKYDYGQGWHACANYRWAEPANRGVAPDPTYRKPYRLIP
jgi:hypothetical protein